MFGLGSGVCPGVSWWWGIQCGASMGAWDLFCAISVLPSATPMPTCSDLNLEG